MRLRRRIPSASFSGDLVLDSEGEALDILLNKCKLEAGAHFKERECMVCWAVGIVAIQLTQPLLDSWPVISKHGDGHGDNSDKAVKRGINQ